MNRMADNNSGTGDGERPPRTWIGANAMWAKEWIKVNPLWASAHVINLLAGFVLFIVDLIKNFPDFSPNFPILTVVIAMCIIFVQIYSDPIESLLVEGSTSNDRRKIEEIRSGQRNKWMIFAYSFMLLSLLLTFYPFINPLFDTRPDAGKSSHNQVKQPGGREEIKSDSEQHAQAEQPFRFEKNEYLRTLRERPIAVFIGCTLDSNAKNLRCEESKQGNAAQSKGQKESNSADEKDNQPPTGGGEGNQSQAMPVESSMSVGHAWVINIGGYIQECSPEKRGEYGESFTCKVKDGLLIPLYFIILALMGGSISLTRRLPELQKQVGTEHVATETQPKLTQYEFREYLIFQMVQFISAPFLAILAYYLIEPSNTTQAVVLAFTAGFASETILLMIRSIANKITPETTTTIQYGAIAGVVTQSNNSPESGKPVGRIEVFLSGLPQKRSITDESGFYMLDNIPVGDHGIIFKSQDDQGNAVEVKDMVKIGHAQAIVKKNVTIVLRQPGEDNK
jgi:hypothetical protein